MTKWIRSLISKISPRRFALALAILAVPCIALAQAAGADVPAPAGISTALIVLGLTAASAILPLTKALPGFGTMSNILTGVIAALTAAFTPLAQAHPTMTLSAIGLAAIGAVIGYFRSEKRAGVVAVPDVGGR